MTIRKILLFFGFLIIGTDYAFSQSVTAPNYALKSHETLEIRKIETTDKATLIYMDIENRIKGGSFCADNNIYIIYPNGKRNKLLFSSGIPVCPDSYKFKYPGEKLDFVLTFQPIPTGTEVISLVEECSENCFSFYGIILNRELNKKLDDAFILVDKGESDKALNSFIEIAEEITKKNMVVSDLLYLNIIKLSEETGNKAKASEWYNRLKSSGTLLLQKYVEYLDEHVLNK
ncbi:MAG TPA: hypothetical protein PLR88_11350 [Bacteroidales bacterium]|nr:hypothetical protein [Bacteroidales bacterium]